MYRSAYLLQVLLALLAARGLAHDALMPWHGWVTFKHYVRTVDEVPDPGISVQLTRGSDIVTLRFLRQQVQECGDWLLPVGGVVCEFVFAAEAGRGSGWERWSFDHATLERFIDLVEADPHFTRLMTREPMATAVYWEDV